MNDLLSVTASSRILAAYEEHISREDINLIFGLFHYGSGFREGPLYSGRSFPGARSWGDAEQFLELLDNASDDKTSAAVVDQVFDAMLAHTNGNLLTNEDFPRHRGQRPNYRQLSTMAKRVVAASCSNFLEGMTKETARRKERWLPYQQWLGSLRENDSILTFNYDRVIELLSPTVVFGPAGSSRWGAHVEEVQDTLQGRDRADMAMRQMIPKLYKLHGSVDWKIIGHNVHAADWSKELLGQATELAIATPGDNKMEMAGGIFGKLWSRAANALQEANEVFIIGFRFPQSDAFPRDKLLAPLADNEQGNLNVHVILGPEQSADLRRVLALLKGTVFKQPTLDEWGDRAGRMLIAHSLWTEDYLSLWARVEAEHLELDVPTVER